MADNQLFQALESVRKRVLAVGVAAGAGWMLAAIVGLVLLFAWADLALELSPGLRLACLWISLPAGAVLLFRAAYLSLRSGSPRSIARRIDRITNSGGQILSGVDLWQQYRGTVAAPTLSGQLASLAVERAAELAARVRSATAVPANPLILPYVSLGALLVAVSIIALAAPRLLATQWSRFTDPYGDHPPYSNIQFKVEPGDTRIVYGSALDVRATPEGGAVEAADLTFHAEGQPEESIPMFPEPGGTWRATVSQITAGGTYVVRAGKARTHKFRFDVITVPELRDVRVRITPPAYTHLPPYAGPVPDRGISGLPGTKVELWAKSNRPLSSGTIALSPADQVAGKAAAPAPVNLSPTEAGASEVTGSFLIANSGKLTLTIIDTGSQPCREPYATSVTVLKDERPFVRILEPKENSFATPDARLEVTLAAEDDYGISSLQLFRGLNDTRPTSVSLPVPANQPTRIATAVPFDLTAYGLVPGDTVKFYARVEDNDPAGAKGSESTVVTLHIISTEDFNRMTAAQQGLEALEANYAMAGRLMEGFDDQLKKLQDELQKAPPDSPLAKEKKEQIQKLSKEMKDAAAELADAAKEGLPFDVDKEFRKELADVAKSLSDAADETDSVDKDGLPSGKAGDKLGEIRKKLGGKRQEFKKQVTQPLDNLDKIFPLIEDQARFVEIWQRQQDLAERMKPVANARADDPKTKARMRDLEAEQRQLVLDLNELLNDIRNHAIRLPIVGRPLVRSGDGDGAAYASASGSEQPSAICAGSAPRAEDVTLENGVRSQPGNLFVARVSNPCLQRENTGWKPVPRIILNLSADPTTIASQVRVPQVAVRRDLCVAGLDAAQVSEYRDLWHPKSQNEGTADAPKSSAGNEASAAVFSGNWVMALTGALIVADDPSPEDKQLKDTLEDLQRTAFEFITKVRASGAFEQMNQSAADLGAFNGADAAVNAQAAADTLKKFIKESQAMQGKLRGMCVLVFRPNIAQDMQSTIDQLLGDEGLQPGAGTGNSGGFSQRRSSLRNSSLYGHVPSRSPAGGSRSGRPANGPSAGGSPNGQGDRDAGGHIDPTRLQASGESDAVVPPQYKHKVGEYFQRVADELGQE